MSIAKLVLVALLILIGINLLLYSYLRRRIADAKREKDVEP
jgi:hypothetical protein